MRKRIVIFLHVPKAAGSTLNRVIAQQYAPEAIYKTGSQPRATLLGEVAEATRPPSRIRLITGHASFGLHAAIEEDFTYITVLRDPVARLISHFQFAGRLPGHPLHESIASGRLGIRDVAGKLANLQTRYLVGEESRAAGRPLDEGALAQAKENLTRHFAVVGLAERFDETLALLQRRLGWKVRRFQDSNVAVDRPARPAHSEADLAAIREINAIDIALYEWARAHIDEVITAGGPDLQREVARLRALKPGGWQERLRVFLRGQSPSP